MKRSDLESPDAQILGSNEQQKRQAAYPT